MSACACALALAFPASPQSVAKPLSFVESGTDHIATGDEFQIIFDDDYNGGIAQWYDLAHDPLAKDSLSGWDDAAVGPRNLGGLFGYGVTLGSLQGTTLESQENRFATTVQGWNHNTVLVHESTAGRIVIRQHQELAWAGPKLGYPHLQKLALYQGVYVWYTIYPTGEMYVHVDGLPADSEEIVATGPGGSAFATSIDTNGDVVSGFGVDFLYESVLPGDTIESSAGGFGPIRIQEVLSASQLKLENAVASGSLLDFTIVRDRILKQTFSLLGDGHRDESLETCNDLAESRWINQEDIVATATGSPTLIGCSHDEIGGATNQAYIVHAAKNRPAGALMATFQEWEDDYEVVFNDTGYLDQSYTQFQRMVAGPPEQFRRSFLVQLGSSAATDLPTIKTLADARPFAEDYRNTKAEMLVGSFATSEWSPFTFKCVEPTGYDPAAGLYWLRADAGRATIRFNPKRRLGDEAIGYYSPIVSVINLAGDLDIAISSDRGKTFAPLEAERYNLFDSAHGATLHFLDDVPPTAIGHSAIALRISDLGVNVAPEFEDGARLRIVSGKNGKRRGFSRKLCATDADNDLLTWSVVQQAKRGIVTLSTDTTGYCHKIRYSDVRKRTMSDVFYLGVTDPYGNTDVLQVIVDPS